MARRKNTNPIDWPAVQAAYESGPASITAIARQHGCTHSAICTRSKAEGWTRPATSHPHTPPTKPKYDWAAIRADYVAGVPAADLTRRHGAAHATITATAEQWPAPRAGGMRDYRVISVAEWIAELRAAHVDPVL